MIPVPSVEQIRAADAFTIANEPISSVDLMERASGVFTNWFCEIYQPDRPVIVLCGMGNNGGDGLCIARLLHDRAYDVSVFILEHRKNGSADFQYNLDRLKAAAKLEAAFLEDASGLDQLAFQSNTIIIDALWGSGLNRPLEGLAELLVERVNERPPGIEVVAVDIPSGLSAEGGIFQPAIAADRCLSFEFPKLAFLLPHCGELAGKWEFRGIGLHPEFVKEITTAAHLTEAVDCELKPRPKFSHKGTFGHVLVVGGEPGKQGAAYLTASAALATGAGLVSVDLLDETVNFNPALPEVMHLTANTTLSRPHRLVIGPGLGTGPNSLQKLKDALKTTQEYNFPIVLDADGLNLLAKHEALWEMIPTNSILSPHPGEFSRLAAGLAVDEDASSPSIRQLKQLSKLAQTRKVIIILKGAHSCIASPEGNYYFNTTGNPGMATAGSGDVLSGLLASLLAQGYAPLKAALTAVWLHGTAGDIASAESHVQSLRASDLIDYLPQAFKQLEKFGKPGNG